MLMLVSSRPSGIPPELTDDPLGAEAKDDENNQDSQDEGDGYTLGNYSFLVFARFYFIKTNKESKDVYSSNKAFGYPMSISSIN